jgi:cell fate regulator YaaT (PSP1 superfamily)
MVSLSQGKDAEPSAGAGGGKPYAAKLARYGAMNWVGEFAHRPGLELPCCGAKVVLQTERGIELGEYLGPCGWCFDPTTFRAQIDSYLAASGPEFCQMRAGRILRAASDQDLREQNHLNAHILDDIQHCAASAAQLGLDMKVITAEHLLGGERIVFYFQAVGRVDFRQLVHELAQRYRTRIEMRQVGARDEARLVADYEICGRECCCKGFLKKLRPVNMKMAKLQKSTLDPTKVSGRCGRLRCCLRYEHAGYEGLAARLPRVGSRVGTDAGPATVLGRQILTQLVSVQTDDERLMVIPFEEIRAFNLPPAPPKPPPAAARGEGERVPADAARRPVPPAAPRGNGRRGAWRQPVERRSEPGGPPPGRYRPEDAPGRTCGPDAAQADAGSAFVAEVEGDAAGPALASGSAGKPPPAESPRTDGEVETRPAPGPRRHGRRRRHRRSRRGGQGPSGPPGAGGVG